MDPDFLYAEMMRAVKEGRTVEAKGAALALDIHLRIGGRYPEGVDEDTVDENLAEVRKPSESWFFFQPMGGCLIDSPVLISVRPGRWWDVSDSGPWRNPGDPEIDLSKIKHYMLRHRVVNDEDRRFGAITIQGCEEGSLEIDMSWMTWPEGSFTHWPRSWPEPRPLSLPIGGKSGPNHHTVFGDGLY